MNRDEDAYFGSIAGKTASLMATACRIGAIVGGLDRPAVDSLTEYGRHAGMIFQIVDDVLDATGTAEELGKTPGKDEATGKATYVSLFGLERARDLADETRARVLERLGALPARTGVLVELVETIRDRRT